MKMSIAEAMKKIKELNERKDKLISAEDYRCTVSYREGENVTAAKYDYDETRKKVDSVDREVRNIKQALAVANATLKIEGFDLTVGAALVTLAQLRQKEAQLDSLARRLQLSRRLTANGVLEYTKCLYDVEKAALDLEDVQKTISNLQLAIDKANIVNLIDV